MSDSQTQQRFIQLRSEGWSFARIATELRVSKPTLIKWSRKFQHDIQNLRAIELEALIEKWLSTVETRVDALGHQLLAIEQELSKRDLSTVPTARLHTLADFIRRQIHRETGRLTFSSSTRDIPKDEYYDEVQDWTP
jgi:hypothetical protein